MENYPTSVWVAAAVISDPSGRILLQQCPAGKRHAGLWEFPGGKLEAGETPRAALVREINEELGITLTAGAMNPAGFAEESAGEGKSAIVLFLYNCPVWQGDPDGRDGQAWGWFSRAEAARLPLPPMDRALLAGMPLPQAG
jgi:8-oxo-dGTP diphosphatase